MTCFSPIQGYESCYRTKNGKYGTTLNLMKSRRKKSINSFGVAVSLPISRILPCRKCEGCRLADSREKAVKIMFEAQITDNGFAENCSFITLTYNDDFIPMYGSLDYFGDCEDSHIFHPDWTHFLKRFRKAIAPHKIRYYMIGEYGDLNLRPHYHAIIFGYNFPDKYEYLDRGGNIIYRSKFLESLWTVPRGKPLAGTSLGYCSIGNVSFDSAAYVARYCMKKNIGTQFDGYEEYFDDDAGLILLRPKLDDRYVRYNPVDGNRIVVHKERALMSNGGGSTDGAGGIGKLWFDAYHNDVYRKLDFDVYKDQYEMPDGRIVRPPKYFDKLLERVNPQLLESIKLSRQDHMSRHADDFTPDLLRQRRECLLAKLSRCKRSIRNVYVK